MKICFWGDFDPEYNRNRVLIQGIKDAGGSVSICRTDKYGWRGAIELCKKYRKSKKSTDYVFVAYSNSRHLVPLIKVLSRKPVIWDAFYSRYDTIINDRKLASPASLKSVYHWLSDWSSCFLADVILLDTDAHISYFSEEFFIPKKKFIRVLIGAENKLFHPKQQF